MEVPATPIFTSDIFADNLDVDAYAIASTADFDRIGTDSTNNEAGFDIRNMDELIGNFRDSRFINDIGVIGKSVQDTWAINAELGSDGSDKTNFLEVIAEEVIDLIVPCSISHKDLRGFEGSRTRGFAFEIKGIEEDVCSVLS